MFSGVIGSMVPKGPPPPKLNPVAARLQKEFEQQQKNYLKTQQYHQQYQQSMWLEQQKEAAQEKEYQKNVQDAYEKNAKEFEAYEKTGDLERTPEQLCQCTGKCRCENGESCSTQVCDVDSRCIDGDARWETNSWGLWKFPWRKIKPCDSSFTQENDLRGPTVFMTGGGGDGKKKKGKRILNPKTGRWVKRDGRIGRAILAERRHHRKKIN
jgi:hypothetical protein